MCQTLFEVCMGVGGCLCERGLVQGRGLNDSEAQYTNGSTKAYPHIHTQVHQHAQMILQSLRDDN